MCHRRAAIRLVHFCLYVAPTLLASACGNPATPPSRCSTPIAVIEVPQTCQPSDGLPPEPPNDWDWLYRRGCYQELLDRTSTAIHQGTIYLAEAHLYRALALLATEGELQTIRDSLTIAEQGSDALSTIDAQWESLQLYTGLMIVSAKLADAENDAGLFHNAERYRDLALQLACPDQATAIEDELVQRRWNSAIR